MTDDFLHNLRKAPSEAFSRQLATRLEFTRGAAASPIPRFSKFWPAVVLFGATAFALASPALREIVVYVWRGTSDARETAPASSPDVRLEPQPGTAAIHEADTPAAETVPVPLRGPTSPVNSSSADRKAAEIAAPTAPATLLMDALLANAAGECPEDLFTPGMQRACQAQISDVKDTFQKLGPLKSVVRTGAQPMPSGGSVPEYKALFEHGEWFWLIQIDDQSHLSMMWAPNPPHWLMGTFKTPR